MLKQDSIDYVEKYIGRKLTKEELKKIESHCKRYNTLRICAWYADWNDFCSDWCDNIGYSKKEARELLHGGRGEFKTINSIGILRFDI